MQLYSALEARQAADELRREILREYQPPPTKWLKFRVWLADDVFQYAIETEMPWGRVGVSAIIATVNGKRYFKKWGRLSSGQDSPAKVDSDKK